MRSSVRFADCVAGLIFVLAATAAAAQTPEPGDVAARQLPDGATRFTLFTPGGYAGFTAGGDWPVVAMQSRLPVAVAAFQIPDPTDAGTSDSTNLAVSLYQPGTPRGDAAMAKNEAAHASWTKSSKGTWSIAQTEAPQGATFYTVLDAQAPCGEVVCGVRLAWPHLTAHAKDYDARMRALFEAFLASVAGAKGAYPAQPGDMVRRPEN